MLKDNKILLIYPDYRSGFFTNVGLPVGLGYIAHSLQISGIDYEIVDLNLESIDYLVSRITNFMPKFLGISLMSQGSREAYNLLNFLKNKFSELVIIAGGPHVTANQERVLMDCKAIDLGVVGEGEHTIVEIIKGTELSEIKGLLFRKGDLIKCSGNRPFINDLDQIPFPTYEGFELEKYSSNMVLNSSRGCPYNCIFCGSPKILGKIWRKRSVQSMITEFQFWYDKGYRSFYFNDSNFALDKKRLVEFCDEIIKRNFEVRFTADGIRADHLSREILEKMRQAGFNNITFGVESGSNKVLKNLNKGETREQIESAIRIATNLGFNVGLFFLIGSPGEGPDDIKQSFELATKYNVAKVYFFNLTPIPGTEFYNWACERGYYSDKSSGLYPEGNFGFSKIALIRTDVMTIPELNWWIEQARRIENQIEIRAVFHRIFAKIVKGEYIINIVKYNFLFRILSHPNIYPLINAIYRYLSSCYNKAKLRKRKTRPSLNGVLQIR